MRVNTKRDLHCRLIDSKFLSERGVLPFQFAAECGSVRGCARRAGTLRRQGLLEISERLLMSQLPSTLFLTHGRQFALQRSSGSVAGRELLLLCLNLNLHRRRGLRQLAMTRLCAAGVVGQRKWVASKGKRA